MAWPVLEEKSCKYTEEKNRPRNTKGNITGENSLTLLMILVQLFDFIPFLAGCPCVT